MLKQLPVFIVSAFLLVLIFSACSSNSEYAENADNGIAWKDDGEVDYLPIDDSEYPYAGIPRIVIETENFRTIKDKETEIPAKLQIWGEKMPESEIMNLTIRGRGNTTWRFPKKPYAIKFEKKQAFLGMPEAKKWVMLANYRDRTLIRNALTFEIARSTSQKWVPQGRFVDVFLNRKYIGNYFICEKIEVKNNRLKLDDDGFLLELDEAYDERYKFKTSHKRIPINIKYPNELDSNQFNFIRDYVEIIEDILYGKKDNLEIGRYLNLQSVASFWIVQEVVQNIEASHPKSMYAYKDAILNFGPVWDFDWGTFSPQKKGLLIKNYLWLDKLVQNKVFQEQVKLEWTQVKQALFQKKTFIDSLVNYIGLSEKNNHALWPIELTEGLVGDEGEDYSTSIRMLQNVFFDRLNELDSLFNGL